MVLLLSMDICCHKSAVVDEKAHWRLLAVRCSALLAICFKSFVKNDMALRDVSVK